MQQRDSRSCSSSGEDGEGEKQRERTSRGGIEGEGSQKKKRFPVSERHVSVAKEYTFFHVAPFWELMVGLQAKQGKR